jgi:hypothetical protein
VRRLACRGGRRYDLASMALGRCMAALVCGALGIVGSSGLASAEKSYPVRIESAPSGATLYLDSKENEPLGRTPYEGKLPAGNHTIIVELEGFVAQVSEISVEKKKKPAQKFKLKLNKLEKGTIEVVPAKAQGQVAGARVFVDGKEEGNLPDTIKVEAGPHQVEVKKEGFRNFEEWVEVAEGQTTRVTAQLVPTDGSRTEVAASDGGNGGDEGGDDDVEEDDSDVEVEDDQVERPSTRTVPFIGFGAGFELGARSFRYTNPTEGNLRPYDAGGVPMIRLSGELVPLAFASSKLASGWTFLGSYGRSTPLDSTATINQGQPNETPVSVPTTWSELDLGLGYRYRFGDGDASYAGLVGGYGIHTFTFDFDAESDILETQIPDVKYRFIYLGLDGRFAFAGRFAALVGGGTRLVRTTGNIGDNFEKTDVLAFGFDGGLAAGISKSIEARLVGRYDQYNHTFTEKPEMNIVADGGTDRFFGVTLSAFFFY